MEVFKNIFKNIPRLFNWLILTVFIGPVLTYIVMQIFIDKPTNITIYKFGIFLSIVFVLSISGFLWGAIATVYNLSKKNTQINVIDNSVFIAAPMKAFYTKKRGEEYEYFRTFVIEIMELLKKECGIADFYYAGQFIKDQSEFQTPDVSIRENMRHLFNKEYFVLIYPEKDATRSALIETGISIALNKKSIYFVKTGVELPFFLKNITSAYHNIKIYEFDEYEAIRTIIVNNKLELFNFIEPISA